MLQWEIMLEFMERHGDLAAAQFGPSQSREQIRQLWESLAEQLNSEVSGANKDYKKWAKAWADWKHKVKLKAAKIEAAKVSGEQHGPPLTPLELRLVNFMNWEFDTSAAEWATQGGESVFEKGTDFNGSDDDGDDADMIHEPEFEDIKNLKFDNKGTKKVPTSSSERSMALFAEIERDRVTLKRKTVMRMNRQIALEERRVSLEEKRLALEEKRYALEQRRLPIEERKLAAEKATSETILNALQLLKEAFDTYTASS